MLLYVHGDLRTIFRDDEKMAERRFNYLEHVHTETDLGAKMREWGRGGVRGGEGMRAHGDDQGSLHP